MHYLVLFKDDGGNTFSAELIAADNDGDAIARARKLFRSGIGRGYDIRQGDRLVHCEGWRALARPPATDRAAEEQWTSERVSRAIECWRLAGEARDPVLRLYLLALHKRLLESASGASRRSAAHDRGSMPQHFPADGGKADEADSDGEVHPAVLHDASSDGCARYEG